MSPSHSPHSMKDFRVPFSFLVFFFFFFFFFFQLAKLFSSRKSVAPSWTVLTVAVLYANPTLS